MALAGPALTSSLCAWLRNEHLQLPRPLAGEVAPAPEVCGVLGGAGLSWDEADPTPAWTVVSVTVSVVVYCSQCGVPSVSTTTRLLSWSREAGPPLLSRNPGVGAASGLGPVCSLLACSAGTFPFSEWRGT